VKSGGRTAQFSSACGPASRNLAASMLTASLWSEQTRISVAEIPAASRIRGLAALPFTVEGSRRPIHCRSRHYTPRRIDYSRHSLPRERVIRRRAGRLVPAPQMMIFRVLLYTNEIVRKTASTTFVPCPSKLTWIRHASHALEIEHHSPRRTSNPEPGCPCAYSERAASSRESNA